MLCRDVDDLLTSGSQLEKLIVVHPAIIPVEAQILYVAYDGWIYSGRYQWSLDKLILTDSYGKKMSFCKETGKLLPSGLPVKMNLKEGDCIGSSLKAPDYPIAPFKKYPKRPLDHHIGGYNAPSNKKYPPDHKIKPSSGQDVFYVTNSVATRSEEPSTSTGSSSSSKDPAPTVKIVTINDEVAPISVPEKPLSFHAGHTDGILPTGGGASSIDVKKPYLKFPPSNLGGPPPPKASVGPPPPTNNRFKYPYHHIKQNPKWTSKPHIGGPPPIPFANGHGPTGSWSLVTSRPGSLPPPVHIYQSSPNGRPGSKPKLTESNGVDVKFGPKLPSSSQFPSRRRPSTGGHYHKPPHQVLHHHHHLHHQLHQKKRPAAPPPPPPILGPPHRLPGAGGDLAASGSETSEDTIHIGDVDTESEEAKDKEEEEEEEEEVVSSTVKTEESNSTEHTSPAPEGESVTEAVPAKNTSSQVKKHLLADDQLTILKIGPDNKMENTTFDDDKQEEEEDAKDPSKKVDYIILHKLPNGEALDLENLQTYTMADIQKGKVPLQAQEKNGHQVGLGMYETPHDVPRSAPDYDTFSVSEGNDGLRPDALLDLSRLTHPLLDPEDEADHLESSPPPPVLPPIEQLVVSERPRIKPEVYQPKPLRDMVDLDAMPFSEEKPVYIIHREDLENHPYYVNFKDPVKTSSRSPPVRGFGRPPPPGNPRYQNNQRPSAADIELMKLPRSTGTGRHFHEDDSGFSNLPTGDQLGKNRLSTSAKVSTTSLPAVTNEQTSTISTLKPALDGSDWIPIPTKQPRPTFGPQMRPKDYVHKPVNFQQINKLTDLAAVTLTNVGPLAEEIKRRHEGRYTLDHLRAKVRHIPSLQLLPDKLSSFLTHVEGKDRALAGSGQRPGLFRENKIAPIFKQDIRRLPGHNNNPSGRNSRRIPPNSHYQNRPPTFQSQILPKNAPSHRYIPLHVSRRKHPNSRLWWQPIPPTTIISDNLEAPKALIRDDLYVENAGFERSKHESSSQPEIIAAHSVVEISSPKTMTTNRRMSYGTEDVTDLRGLGGPLSIPTSTESRIIRLQQPFLTSNIVQQVNNESAAAAAAEAADNSSEDSTNAEKEAEGEELVTDLPLWSQSPSDTVGSEKEKEGNSETVQRKETARSRIANSRQDSGKKNDYASERSRSRSKSVSRSSSSSSSVAGSGGSRRGRHRDGSANDTSKDSAEAKEN